MTYSSSPKLRKPDYFSSQTLICNIMDLHRDIAKLSWVILLQLVVLAGGKQIRIILTIHGRAVLAQKTRTFTYLEVECCCLSY